MRKTIPFLKILPILAAVSLMTACVPFLSQAPTAAVTATTAPAAPAPTTAVQAATSAPAATIQAPTGEAVLPGTPQVPDTGVQSTQSLPTVEPTAGATATATKPSPVCAPSAPLTPSQTEGPYFKAGSPEQSSLAGNLPGTRLVLTGYVVDNNCEPIPNALLDFWQADSQGQYDNTGYTLRGHQYTNDNGAYRLETVVPGEYPGRTEHIHVKVQAPNGPVLTTQLYFPGVAQNDRDGIYNPALLIQIQSSTADQVVATFNFIIAK